MKNRKKKSFTVSPNAAEGIKALHHHNVRGVLLDKYEKSFIFYNISSCLFSSILPLENGGGIIFIRDGRGGSSFAVKKDDTLSKSIMVKL